MHRASGYNCDLEDKEIVDLGNLDTVSSDWMKGDAKVRHDAKQNQQKLSSAMIIGMMLRQAGGRIFLEPTSVADPLEAFTTIELEDGSIVVLNRAYSVPQDEAGL